MSKPIQQPLFVDVPEQLSTPRLMLRIPRMDDKPLVWPAVDESRGELAPWFPWASPPTETGVDEFCRRAAANFILRQQLHYLLFEPAAPQVCLGGCGINRMDWSTPRFEISYWLRTSFCGKGCMTEAVGAVERMCFDICHAARVEIVADVRNTRSRRVAERAGYVLEGILCRHRRDTAGELCDMCVYAKTAANA